MKRVRKFKGSFVVWSFGIVGGVAFAIAATPSCESSTDTLTISSSGGGAGAAGTAGIGGAGGTGATAASGEGGGETGGNGNEGGGSAGEAGTAGTGGDGGTGGEAGTGGVAGSGGVAGTGGSAGTGGVAGTGGTAGAGGSGTTCPSGFVLIHAGEFMMGSPEGELGRNDDETEHKVKLTNAFCMQKTEVTQEQYTTVMEKNPSHFTNCGNKCPVEKVSWNMAVKYCNKLSKNESLKECYTCNMSGCSPAMNPYECNGYRLPTEAEWEYAARAGETTASYNGDILVAGDTCETKDDILDPIAWYCNNANDTTHPVGGKAPNTTGLFDMSGNVWEWCHDWYGSYSTSTITQNPTGPGSGSDRVIRGGSWYRYAKYCRSAKRFWQAQGIRYYNIGFRPVVAPK